LRELAKFLHFNFPFLMELVMERISSHSSKNVWLKKLKEVIASQKSLSEGRREILLNLTSNNKKIFDVLQSVAESNPKVYELLLEIIQTDLKATSVTKITEHIQTFFAISQEELEQVKKVL